MFGRKTDAADREAGQRERLAEFAGWLNFLTSLAGELPAPVDRSPTIPDRPCDSAELPARLSLLAEWQASTGMRNGDAVAGYAGALRARLVARVDATVDTFRRAATTTLSEISELLRLGVRSPAVVVPADFSKTCHLEMADFNRPGHRLLLLDLTGVPDGHSVRGIVRPDEFYLRRYFSSGDAPAPCLVLGPVNVPFYFSADVASLTRQYRNAQIAESNQIAAARVEQQRQDEIRHNQAVAVQRAAAREQDRLRELEKTVADLQRQIATVQP